jgi:hypothetical protein
MKKVLNVGNVKDNGAAINKLKKVLNVIIVEMINFVKHVVIQKKGLNVRYVENFNVISKMKKVLNVIIVEKNMKNK